MLISDWSSDVCSSDLLLFDPEFLGDTDLSPLPRLAQVLQGHLFSNQLRRARLDLLSARLRQFIHPLLQRRHLDLLLFSFSRARCESKRSSAFLIRADRKSTRLNSSH